MVRLEVAPDRWVKGGDRALSPRWADRKSPGSGVFAFNAAAGGGAPKGRGGAGGACAARAGAAGQSSGWERAGALRAPGPRAGSAQEPRECRERAPGTRRSSGTAREPRERWDRAGGAERGGPSAPPAGAAARLGPGSGGQDVRAEASFLPVPWLAALTSGLRKSFPAAVPLEPASPPQCCWESPGLGEGGCLSHLELAISVHASLGISIFLHDFSL
ncbi:unnamed protein product [Rangifer tarandus platyrhynchus]|uniref:Uncharacterized protein n=1 Tax=Rangifer tarandus platyrhynchus TaxID=3082113 RepID=A0AC59YWS4_RANTA